MQYLGVTQRNKPVSEIRNEGEYFGNDAYPTYGTELQQVLGTSSDKTALRNALIAESSYLTATGTANAGGGGYVWMNSEGKLFNGTTSAPVPVIGKDGTTQRQLYKHTASVGLYLGDVADDEPAIIKKVTMRSRGYDGYSVTGVYAPAGEVIAIQLTEDDMEATGGIVIHIGQALYNGKANNIWAGKNAMPRIPHLLNTMTINKDTATLEDGVYTAYVGSFIGGPVYIRNEDVTFSAVISGGVAYSHFILGYTTQQEFEENARSSAPYFDMEIWDRGILHSGPACYADGFTYDDIYKAAVLWDKVTNVSTTGSNQGIVMLYDPFVAAGAAVAFPGQRSVNCPVSWMSASLDYDGIVKNGCWGNFHEYNHNFQGYGVGDGGEVTNNALTLVSYSLFTEISANRSLDNYGAQGLGTSWNRYTCATWALEETNKIARGITPDNGTKGLALYATLLHNFGQDNFMQAKLKQISEGYGQSYEGYLRAWQEITHNDMTYYFKDILCGISEETANSLSNPDYPTFIPVSSVYQTGRSYMYDGEKKYIYTMQPYVIPYDDDEFTVDLRRYTEADGQYSYGSMVLPDGFSFSIKNVTQPENGRLTETDTDGVYVYSPDANGSLLSGKIIVTIELSKDGDASFKTDDVDIVIEFRRSHENTKWTLTRTTYSYAVGNAYTDAQEAYENGYSGYISKTETDHTNFTQNCNTDIWYRPDLPQYADDPYLVPSNSVVEIRGKLYAEEEGKYRIYLRGRNNCALYYSTDGGKTFLLGATIKDNQVINDSAYFRPDDDQTYFDLELSANSWIYFREVLITGMLDGNKTSYIGLGMEKWSEPVFTIIDKYYDADGNEVSSAEDKDYHHTETHYYNYLGEEVTEAEASASGLTAPVVDKSNQPYVNAYRESYTFTQDDFSSEYLYKRTYVYDYSDNLWQSSGQTTVSTNYADGVSWNYSLYPVENLTDGDRNTFIHTKGIPDGGLQIVMDMGEVKSVNRMTVYSQYRPNGDWQVAKSFTLEGSTDGETFFMVAEYSGLPFSGQNLTVDFEERSFRYYRLVITESHSTHLIIGEIEMWRCFELDGFSQFTLDDDSFNFSGSWQGAQTSSTFGHVYVGAKGSSFAFEFEGTRVGFLSSSVYGDAYEVYIDGKKCSSVALKDDDSDYCATFISDYLGSGKHRVEVKCTGEAGFDSVIILNGENG